MNIELPGQLKDYAVLFAKAGISAYVSGDAVRNILLCLPGGTARIRSSLSCEEAAHLFTLDGAAVAEKYGEPGTLEIAYGENRAEYEPFRAGPRFAVPEGLTKEALRDACLAEDARHGDFTVNALYAELISGEIYDPAGGLDDLLEDTLRAIDPENTFKEEPLRVLRLARYAAQLGFMPEEETLLAARSAASALSGVDAEKKRDELTMLLLSDTRYPGRKGDLLKGLLLFSETGAIDSLIPELAEGRGLQQKPEEHRCDVLEHSLRTAFFTPPDLVLRLAGLLHDVGKPRVYRETGRFLGHDRAGEEMALEILRRIGYPEGLVRKAAKLVRWHMYDPHGTARETTLRVKFGEWGREFTEKLILIREADVRGCGTDSDYLAEHWREILLDMERRNTPFSMEELALTGADVMRIMGVRPSPETGRIMDALWRRCLVKPEDNTPEKLTILVRSGNIS